MTRSLRKRTVSLPRLRAVPTSSWIQEQIQQQLCASPYRELATVDCRVFRGVAFLDGAVSSFYLKQIAQSVARRVPGVQRILNQVHVRTFEEQREHALRQNQWYHVGRLNDGLPRPDPTPLQTTES